MTSFVMIDASFTFKLLMPNPLREQHKQLVRQWKGYQDRLVQFRNWTSLFFFCQALRCVDRDG